MQIMWSPGSENRCYVNACPTVVTMGLGVYGSGAGKATCATIQIEYPLPDLIPVSVILKGMRDKQIVPEVYLWDELADEPEVAVLFRIKNPELRLLQTLLGDSRERLAEAIHDVACSELITTGEANIPRVGGVEPFLGAFRQQGIGLVVVRESSDDSLLDEAATFAFTVNKIMRCRPNVTL